MTLDQSPSTTTTTIIIITKTTTTIVYNIISAGAALGAGADAGPVSLLL